MMYVYVWVLNIITGLSICKLLFVLNYSKKLKDKAFQTIKLKD